MHSVWCLSYINYSLGQTKRLHGSISQDQSHNDPRRWCSHPQDLQILVVANGYPVGLGGAPLDLVDLPLCSCVSQNWVLNCPRHLLDVPDQSLVIVSSSANVTGRMWGPGNSIDTGTVVVQSCNWSARHSDIEDDDFTGIHGDCGEIIGVLLVPGEPQQWSVRR